MRKIWLALLLPLLRAADVTVLMNGDAIVPNPVSYPAKTQVTRIFTAIGVRLVWQSKESQAASPFRIHAKFTTSIPKSSHPGALAYAEPFNGNPVITVMYDRILATAAGRPRLVSALLAHVLAHEIGHILLATDSHANTGIMKALWSNADYEEMERTPMLFEPEDEDSIRKRIATESVQGFVQSRTPHRHSTPIG